MKIFFSSMQFPYGFFKIIFYSFSPFSNFHFISHNLNRDCSHTWSDAFFSFLPSFMHDIGKVMWLISPVDSRNSLLCLKLYVKYLFYLGYSYQKGSFFLLLKYNIVKENKIYAIHSLLCFYKWIFHRIYSIFKGRKIKLLVIICTLEVQEFK